VGGAATLRRPTHAQLTSLAALVKFYNFKNDDALYAFQF